MARDRAALGAFLRDRRDRLTPAQAGIDPFPGARRVPGLRRDELAFLAGLSSDYYSRIEQGRQANVSADVIQALARALRLNDVELAHLADLANPSPARHSPSAARTVQRADPGLLRLMTTLDHVPVLLLGHRAEVLASNALLAAVLGAQLEPGASFPRFFLLEPAVRERVENWEVFAQATVGLLRRELARRPDDRTLGALVTELRVGDQDVARWWEDHAVRDYASLTKRIAHPSAGRLVFDIEAVTTPNDPDQRLVVYTAEPDSRTSQMLPLLVSWSGHPSSR